MSAVSRQQDNRPVPWWVHIGIASVIYPGFAYGFPYLCNRYGFENLAGLGELFAPILTIVFLLAGASALYRGSEEDKEGGDVQEDQGDER